MIQSQMFMSYEGKLFLAENSSLVFMLNINWFQPYKHRTYSVGVIYLAVLYLPRAVRFKRVLIGLIPGPSEPVNSYLTSLVSDLLTLWKVTHMTVELSVSEVLSCVLVVTCLQVVKFVAF